MGVTVGLAAGAQGIYVGLVPGMITSRRRWFGLFFLLMAVGMVIWGQTWLRPHLQGGVYVVYWCICLAWTILALGTAVIDARATRRELREQQMDLLRDTFSPKDGGKRASSSAKRATKK
jgi:hypothetical protein